MDRFTASKALLTGVELIRRRRLLVLSWAVLFFVRAMLVAVLSQGVRAWALARAASGAPVRSLQLPGIALGLVETAFSLGLAAVVLSSAFRAIRRPQTPTFFALGREERLVFASQVITQLIAALPVLAMFGGMLVVHGLGSVLGGSRWIVTVCETFGLFWSYLASAWAFDRLEIAPFRSWAIARGRFWLLAGLVLGVLVLRLVINAGVDGMIEALERALPATPIPGNPLVLVARLSDAFRAPALFRDVIFAALEALEIAILAGIVASAYRAQPPEPQAAAFSSAVSGPAS